MNIFTILKVGALALPLALVGCEKKAEEDHGKDHGAEAHDHGKEGHDHAGHDHAGHDHGGEKAAAQGGKVAITVGDSGYTPAEVSAKANEPLTLVFTRTSSSPCGEVVVVPDHNIKKELPLNKPVEIAFTPTKPGRVGFTCGMAMMKGAIIVQ